MNSIDVAAVKRQLLRSMLIGLGVAALTGALAIFTQAGWVIGRIAGTALILAVAVLFSMTIIGKLENPKTTRAASAALWIVAGSAGAFLVALWAPSLGFFSSDRLWPSAFAIAVTGGIIALMIQGLVDLWTRASAIVGIVMTAASFVLAMTAIWGAGRIREEQYGESAAWIGGVMPIICTCLIGAFDDRRHWRWVGVGCAGVGIVLGLQRTWATAVTYGWEEPSAILQLLTIGGVVAHTIAIDRVPLKPEHRWLALTAMGCAILVGVLVTILTWQTGGWERSEIRDPLMRGFLAASFVTACATLAVPAVYGVERRKSVLQSSAPRKEITAMTITCPHCRTGQDVPVGTSRCTKCGLMITIAFAEPNCERCGYSLLDIAGEVCPECGVKAPPKGVALVLGGDRRAPGTPGS